jgi:hypothetical protein
MAQRMTSWFDTGRDWWTPRRPWPPGMHFEDGGVERTICRYLPPPPAPVGSMAAPRS